jgi:hypothetical protein
MNYLEIIGLIILAIGVILFVSGAIYGLVKTMLVQGELNRLAVGLIAIGILLFFVGLTMYILGRFKAPTEERSVNNTPSPKLVIQ